MGHKCGPYSAIVQTVTFSPYIALLTLRDAGKAAHILNLSISLS